MIASALGPALAEGDVERFDDAVSRYLSFFAAPLVETVIPIEGAVVAMLGCRTGFPETVLLDKLPGAVIHGVDPSEAALVVARRRAEALGEAQVHYGVATQLPTPLASAAFTHALALHPVLTAERRRAWLGELKRVLVPRGQGLLAVPLRGSFPELYDMLREFALRHELTDLGQQVDRAASTRPNLETATEECEDAGFTEVDIAVEMLALSFATGRELLESAAFELLVLPEVLAELDLDAAMTERATAYLHDAVGKYWSDGAFDLTVNVGCISLRT